MVKDEDLWLLIQKDDERSFSILFHRYSAVVFKNAYSYIRDEAICEQVVHDVFLSIWKNRKTLVIRSFRAYLISASRYIVYKQLKTLSKMNLAYVDDLSQHQEVFVENSGYQSLASRDLEEQLNNYLNHLPARCREIFLMSRKRLLNNDEIALELGISKRSVENQLTSALKHLRGSFKDITILLVILSHTT
jgi:RNA polymerase sigma-70 factor (family 1)